MIERSENISQLVDTCYVMETCADHNALVCSYRAAHGPGWLQNELVVVMVGAISRKWLWCSGYPHTHTVNYLMYLLMANPFCIGLDDDSVQKVAKIPSWYLWFQVFDLLVKEIAY